MHYFWMYIVVGIFVGTFVAYYINNYSRGHTSFDSIVFGFFSALAWPIVLLYSFFAAGDTVRVAVYEEYQNSLKRLTTDKKEK